MVIYVKLQNLTFSCVCVCVHVCAYVWGHGKARSSSHSPSLLQLSNYPVSMEKREDAWWRQLPWQPAHLSPTAWRTKHNKQLLVYTSLPHALSAFSVSVSFFSFLCVRFKSFELVSNTMWQWNFFIVKIIPLHKMHQYSDLTFS